MEGHGTLVTKGSQFDAFLYIPTTINVFCFPSNSLQTFKHFHIEFFPKLRGTRRTNGQNIFTQTFFRNGEGLIAGYGRPISRDKGSCKKRSTINKIKQSTCYHMIIGITIIPSLTLCRCKLVDWVAPSPLT